MSVRKNSFPPTDIVGDLWSVALKVVKWNKSSCWVVFFWRSCLEYLIRSSTPIPSTYGCYHRVLQAEVEVDLLQSLWRSVRSVPLSLPSARSSTFVCRFCLQATHTLSILIVVIILEDRLTNVTFKFNFVALIIELRGLEEKPDQSIVYFHHCGA